MGKVISDVDPQPRGETANISVYLATKVMLHSFCTHSSPFCGLHCGPLVDGGLCFKGCSADWCSGLARIVCGSFLLPWLCRKEGGRGACERLFT